MRYAASQGLRAATVPWAPFTVTVSSASLPAPLKLSLEAAVATNRLRRSSWSVSDVATHINLPASRIFVTGSGLLGMSQQRDCDLLLTGVSAWDSLGTPRTTAVELSDLERTILQKHRSFYPYHGQDALELLMRRSRWRRFILGGSAFDISVQYACSDDHPEIPPLTALHPRTIVRATIIAPLHPIYFPAIYATDRGPLFCFTTTLQGALEAGDRITFTGRRLRVSTDDTHSAIVFTDADALLELRPA